MSVETALPTGQMAPIANRTLLELPQTLLGCVFKFLSEKELRTVSLVCRPFLHLAAQFQKIDAQKLHAKGCHPVEYAARKRYFDPVTQRRLDNAVVISPCGHHVNKEAVAKISVKPKAAFQKVINKDEKCPRCSGAMIGWKPDPEMEHESNGFYDLIGYDGRQYRLPKEKKPEGEKAPYPGIPYPGIRGSFLPETAFRIPGSRFFNSTNGSIIEFLNFTSTPGEYKLFLRISSSARAADVAALYTHLERSGIEISQFDRTHKFIGLEEPAQMKTMFEILCAQNDFPQADAASILTEMNATHAPRISFAEVSEVTSGSSTQKMGHSKTASSLSHAPTKSFQPVSSPT